MTENLIGMRELEARLGVKRKAVLRLVALGKLRGLHVGRQWRFDPIDVAAYLEREKQAVVPPDMPAVPLPTPMRASRGGACTWKGADYYLKQYGLVGKLASR